MTTPPQDDSTRESPADPDPEDASRDGDPPLDDPELDDWWTWGNFARLFIFPLILVVVAVVIYGTFQYILTDTRSVNEYIATIESGSPNQRWRAAYDLAQQVQLHGRDKEFSMRSVQSIVRLYRRADDPRVRAYLALVLAKLPLDESRRALVEGLSDSSDTVAIASVQALGEMNADDAAPAITDLLDHPSPQVRLRATYVLGSLGNRSTAVLEGLKRTLDDPEPDIRLNGAMALARLGSRAGEEILLDQLRKALRGDTSPQREEFRQHRLVNVITVLKHLDSEKPIPLLKRISNSDRETRIRKQALETLQALEKRQL